MNRLLLTHSIKGSTVYMCIIIIIINKIIVEKWAKSYRQFHHSDTDTNMFLERWSLCTSHNYANFSFHNKLKTTYLDGKVNRRVDYLLDTLIRMERDYFFRHMYKTQMLQNSPKDQSEIQRHERGISIPITAVKVSKH